MNGDKWAIRMGNWKEYGWLPPYFTVISPFPPKYSPGEECWGNIGRMGERTKEIRGERIGGQSFSHHFISPIPFRPNKKGEMKGFGGNNEGMIGHLKDPCGAFACLLS